MNLCIGSQQFHPQFVARAADPVLDWRVSPHLWQDVRLIGGCPGLSLGREVALCAVWWCPLSGEGRSCCAAVCVCWRSSIGRVFCFGVPIFSTNPSLASNATTARTESLVTRRARPSPRKISYHCENTVIHSTWWKSINYRSNKHSTCVCTTTYLG